MRQPWTGSSIWWSRLHACAFADAHQLRRQKLRSHSSITQKEREFAELVTVAMMSVWYWSLTAESVSKERKECRLPSLQTSLLRSLVSSESLYSGMEDYHTDVLQYSRSSFSTEVSLSRWSRLSSQSCSSSWLSLFTMDSLCSVMQPFTLLYLCSLSYSMWMQMFNQSFSSRHSTRHCKREGV